MKELFLLRGLPGSGKSTLAKSLGGEHIEADMFFMKDGEYKFDATMLKHAHNWCHDVVEHWMENGEERIIVSNTFTTEWEMEYYFRLAQTYGYRVYSLVVENRHGGVNEHGVPSDKLEQMQNRFSIKLI
jgi:predicted kinase